MVKTRLIYALTIAAATLMSAALTSHAHAQRGVELLDFYLPTCGPCKAMAPVIDQLSREGVAVRKVDGSREPGLAQQMRIEGYPTFVAVVDGREIGRIVGATNHANLQELLTNANRIAGQATATSLNPMANSVARNTPSQTFASEQAATKFAAGTNQSPGYATTQPANLTQNDVAIPSQVDSLIASSVRIVIDESGSRSFGTGTIIDARSGEALVATCAHLFKDLQGNLIPTEGNVTLELFESNGGVPHVVERVPGRLVSYNMEADVALVSLRPDKKVTSVPIAPSGDSVVVGAGVQSIGCDLGADPSHRSSKVVSLDRYHGAPNIETTGAPIQGRSGGGLFNAEGELIGICFAADEELDEGLYVGIASVYAELDRVGMSELYQRRAPGSTNPRMQSTLGLAVNEPSKQVVNPFDGQASVHQQASFEERPSRLAPVPSTTQVATAQPTAWPDPVIRGQNMTEPQLSPLEQATLDEVVRRGAKSEVVLLIRPTVAGGKTEVLTLDSASPEFVATLRRMGQIGQLSESY